jgi:hypothetical protein
MSEKHEAIDLTIDDDTCEALIEMFVETKLSEQSVYVFNDYIMGGTSVSDALVHTIINEMANIALTELVEAENTENTENPK